MKTIELFENERAAGYNLFVENWIPNYHYFQGLLPKLLQDIPQKELLVVGCGTGNEIEEFTKSSDAWQVTGIDPSPEMIAQAKVKLQEYNNVQLIEGVLSDLGTDKKYSAATLLLVLHFIPDNGEKLEMLKYIAGRLAPKAPLILLDITGDSDQIMGNLGVLRTLLPHDLDRAKVENRLQRIAQDLHHVAEDRLIELVVEAGFEPPLRFFQSSVYMGWIAYKKCSLDQNSDVQLECSSL